MKVVARLPDIPVIPEFGVNVAADRGRYSAVRGRLVSKRPNVGHSRSLGRCPKAVVHLGSSE
jgi:hypothetical protein